MPSLFTGMWRISGSETVLGRSTTNRSGFCTVVTRGRTGPLATISTLTPPCPLSTFTLSSVAGFWDVWWLASVAEGLAALPAGACMSDAGAVALSTRRIAATIVIKRFCLICVSQNARALAPSVPPLIRIPLPSGLNGRSRNLFHYFPRARFAQVVLEIFLEHDRVAGNAQYVPVEDGIVFPQEISFVHAVHHDRDHAVLGANHALQADLARRQAALARGAAGVFNVRDHRADEGIAARDGKLLADLTHAGGQVGAVVVLFFAGFVRGRRRRLAFGGRFRLGLRLRRGCAGCQHRLLRRLFGRNRFHGGFGRGNRTFTLRRRRRRMHRSAARFGRRIHVLLRILGKVLFRRRLQLVPRVLENGQLRPGCGGCDRDKQY